MAGDSESKTKEELIEEINALREQLAAREAFTGSGTAEQSHQPTFTKPMTRREALTQWVAPVVLSVPVVAALRSETAHAGGAPPPTQAPMPTPMPPTPMPPMPTMAPAPTLAPKSVPALGAAGAVALGGALAAAGAKVLKDQQQASGEESSEGDETRKG